MLHAVSRSLSGAISLPDAIAEITSAARDLIDFERIAVLRIEDADTLRVHAAMHGVAWTEGRLLRRKECSGRLWIGPTAPDRVRDTGTELDPSFPMDREIIERGTRSILRIPLVGRTGPIGMLAFSSPHADAFDEEDVNSGTAIAGLVAMALESERLFGEEVRRRSRRAALDLVLPRVAAARDLDEIAMVLAGTAAGLLPHEITGIVVLHSDESRAHFHVVVDGQQRINADLPRAVIQDQIDALPPSGAMRIQRFETIDPENRRVLFHSIRDGEPFVFEHQFTEEAFRFLEATGLKSQVRVAVRRGPALIGLIAFGSRRLAAFDDEDLTFARRLAERVSLALAHDRLTEESRRAAAATERARALEARVAALQRELEEARGPHAAVGVSRSWRDVLEQATRVAATDTTVLLTGESGTGKEVVARYIHHASPRAAGPFVAINCAALPEQLLEAELFGHEKGAFTGATAARTGRLEQAAGGVLFLDEVGEMSPSVQAKFLRVLQEREFQRLGSARVLKADVRVIAATNRDLRAAIAQREFREDLYYRLHVFAIPLPALRERPEDVLALAEHFLAELGATLGRGTVGMTAEARDALQRYAWPGNARELRNVIERALILSDGALIHPSHLAFTPTAPRPPAAAPLPAPPARDGDGNPPAAPEGPLPESGVDLDAIERSFIERALAQAEGNKSRAARLLGLTRAQLYSRLEKYGL